MCMRVRAQELAHPHMTTASLGEMSGHREEVYLAATDLTARRGRRRVSIDPLLFCDAPWASWALPRARAHAHSWLWCVLSVTDTGLWEMPALCQTCMGCDTPLSRAEPSLWQACDGAELLLNDFLGSITLPKHWTCHLPPTPAIKHLPPPKFPLRGHRSPLQTHKWTLIASHLPLTVD